MNPPTETWLNEQADRVERIFRAHRITARVQGGVVRPRVIQFHLALDRGALHRDLTALEQDLTVALRVPSARLARRDGILALEVPRLDVRPCSLVRLQASLPALAPLTALLGSDDDGGPLLLRLASPEIGHILVVGLEGAGRTALLQALVTSLALASNPDDLRLVLADTAGQVQKWAPFASLPHMVGPVLGDGEAAEKRLAWLVEEAAWRAEARVRTPAVLVALDHGDALIEGRPAAAGLLTQLLQAHPVGIHVLAAVNAAAAGRPARGGLADHFPCRILGPGREAPELNGPDEWLLVVAGEHLRFTAARVEPAEIEVMVELFQEQPLNRRPAAPAPGQPRRRIPLLGRLWPQPS